MSWHLWFENRCYFMGKVVFLMMMCDASDYALGAALGQRQGKNFHVIYYASQTLNDAQLKYTTT